jgi:YrbI family 3-deoxy-D-manno-octulosonate 8-phosphate phosphatase
MKKFNVKDGMAVRLLKEVGVETAIISTDTADIIETRAKRLKVNYLYTGSWDKEEKLKQVCSDLKISAENSAFIGDDLNDIGIINYVGVSACPCDAAKKIIDMVDYVCTKKGGEGVFREFAELIIDAKNKSLN